MTQQFTASEVRAYTHKVGDGIPMLSDMLRAFADLLEAQEKAMPVAVVKDSDALYTGWLSWTGEPAPPETKLYTHPAHSAQAQPPAASVPDAETLRLHLGELTPDEVCVAKAAYALALGAQENPNGV